MARATICVLAGQEIGIEEALQLRKLSNQDRKRGVPKPDFRCVECDEPVRVHKEGGGAQAHFEHFHRNPNCRLSDPGR